MQTRREALAAVGLAKLGRGKFSTEANAWLDAQRAAGVKFSDDNSMVKTVKAEPSTAPVKPKAEGIGYPDYISPDDFRFPESDYRLTFPKGFPYPAKTVGMRNVCDTCRLSLTNHVCDNPSLFGYTVKIEEVRS